MAFFHLNILIYKSQIWHETELLKPTEGQFKPSSNHRLQSLRILGYQFLKKGPASAGPYFKFFTNSRRKQHILSICTSTVRYGAS